MINHGVTFNLALLNCVDLPYLRHISCCDLLYKLLLNWAISNDSNT